MMRLLAVCLVLSILPAQAMAQPAPLQQPPWISEPPSNLEVAVARFGACVRQEIRLLPATVDSDRAEARILSSCSASLVAVEREATRIIDGSRLAPERRALALQALRARLANVGARVGERIERRRRGA